MFEDHLNPNLNLPLPMWMIRSDLFHWPLQDRCWCPAHWEPGCGRGKEMPEPNALRLEFAPAHSHQRRILALRKWLKQSGLPWPPSSFFNTGFLVPAFGGCFKGNERMFAKGLAHNRHHIDTCSPVFMILLVTCKVGRTPDLLNF